MNNMSPNNNSNYTADNNNLNNNSAKDNKKLSPFMFAVFVVVVAFQWILPFDELIKIVSDAIQDETSIVYEIEETTEEETETTEQNEENIIIN